MADPVDLKDRVEQWYFDNPQCSIKEASEEFSLPYETVREWASNESWRTKRIIQDSALDLPDDVKLQANGIRMVLFEKIILGENDAKDLSELVKSWKSLLSVAPEDADDDYLDRDEIAKILNDETD